MQINQMPENGKLQSDRPCGSFMALYQHKPWWNRPAFGTAYSEIPERTQILLIKRGEEYELFLAFCGEDFRTDIRGCEDGILISGAYVHDIGSDPYQMVSGAVRLIAKEHGYPLLREQKRFPEILKYPGWCTWDSLGKGVSEKAIFDKMDEFKEKNVEIGWVLIDDGWSEVDREKEVLRSLDVDYDRFPQGLAHTVKVLKEDYGVRYVGVWQAFNGYWNGVEEGSAAAEQVKDFLKKYPTGELTVKDTAEGSFGFWNTWHRGLAAAGVDFVKIDNQSSFVRLYQQGEPVGERLRAVYEGLEASVLLNFDGNLINCMGMQADNVWTRFRTSLSRSSDDYFPRIPGSFSDHARQNAYNSLYQGELYYGDWDMFWTEHEDNRQSALLRAVSGGPVYISDACGKTDPSILNRFLAADGSLLMCDSVGLPAADCLTVDALENGGILKIFNSYQGAYFVACFTKESDAEEAIDGMLSLKDIPGAAGEYLVLNGSTGEIAEVTDSEPYRFVMKPHDALMLELIPKEEVSVFGFIQKWLPAAGVSEKEKTADGLRLTVSCPGSLLVMSEKETAFFLPDGTRLSADRNGKFSLVTVPEGTKTIECRFPSAQ